MQKAEWRVEVRGEDLLPTLSLHGHPGHPGNSTPFLAPQPLQGPSKPEPRPLPPAPGPPAPTFRYHWYIFDLIIFLSIVSNTVQGKYIAPHCSLFSFTSFIVNGLFSTIYDINR